MYTVRSIKRSIPIDFDIAVQKTFLSCCCYNVFRIIDTILRTKLYRHICYLRFNVFGIVLFVEVGLTANGGTDDLQKKIKLEL